VTIVIQAASPATTPRAFLAIHASSGTIGSVASPGNAPSRPLIVRTEV
jgi:hypothetical protein